MRTRIIAITGNRPPADSAGPEERAAWLKLRDHGYAWVDSLPVEGIVLLHGGAPGIDRELGLRAQRRGIWVQAFPAPWDVFAARGYKSQAGFARNDVLSRMAEEVYAFWDGSSNGTRDTIDRVIEDEKLAGLWLPSFEVVRAPWEPWEDAIRQGLEAARI